MAEKAPILDYTEVRNSASSSASETGAVAVGQTVGGSAEPSASRRASNAKPRPSVKRSKKLRTAGRSSSDSGRTRDAGEDRAGYAASSERESGFAGDRAGDLPQRSERAASSSRSSARKPAPASGSSASKKKKGLSPSEKRMESSAREDRALNARQNRRPEVSDDSRTSSDERSSRQAVGSGRRHSSARGKAKNLSERRDASEAASNPTEEESRKKSATDAGAQAAGKGGHPRKRQPDKAVASGSAKKMEKPSSAGDIASMITNGILTLVTALVEFVKKPHSKAFNRTLVAALACVVALSFVYPSARDYYVAIRDNAKSEAEYAALQEYYKQLQSDVERLSTDEGVEDAARDEFGMVMAGDISMNVVDLDSESNFDQNPTEVGITPAGSVKAPEEWYTPFLDFVFGYDG